jgi:hypothetical protein
MRKTTRRRGLALLLGLALGACSGAELTPEEATDEVVSAVETEPLERAGGEAEGAPPMPKVAAITGITLSRIEVERAEDGHGNLVPAPAPVAIEIAAEAWPVRALDPVLRIGELEFKRYTFPRINVLRFVAADVDALPDGAEVSVQYGADAQSRVVVTERLEVQR